MCSFNFYLNKLRHHCSTISLFFIHFPLQSLSVFSNYQRSAWSHVCLCVMQVHHGVMPSHTMYALNMERILCRLWHPSHEELEQDRVHRQRVAAKDGVLVS